MKYIFILVSLFLFAGYVNSQPEYKISAEGFTYGQPTENTVKLTIYLSAANVGSVDEFNGQLRNIMLISKQDKTGAYYLEEYKRIVDNNKEVSGHTIFLLSYTVPKNVTDLVLVLPPIYGSLNIPITKENYEQWAEKVGDNNNNNNSSNNNNKPTSKAAKVVFDINKYIGIGFGVGAANTYLNNSVTSFLFDLSLYPKLFRFGRNNKYTIGASFSYLPTIHVGSTPEKDIFSYFGYNPKTDSIIYHVNDTASLSSYFLGGGMGISSKFGSAVTTLVCNYGYYTTYTSDFEVRNTEMGYYSGDPSYSGNIWKIDLILSYECYTNFKYSFLYGNISSNVGSNSKLIRGHYFTVGIGGF
ncbi:MAG: hypothetical protein EHM58_14930 [Ignavibacteriae bacterium]|nr:MAG: hypothetical protein EHM58_14930 [Ignavibacteriota bacterium]